MRIKRAQTASCSTQIRVVGFQGVGCKVSGALERTGGRGTSLRSFIFFGGRLTAQPRIALMK